MATPGDIFTGLFGDAEDWSDSFARANIWFDQVLERVEDGSLYPTQEKFDSIVAAWNTLTPRVRRMLAMLTLAIMWMLILGPLITGLLITPPLAVYVLSLTKPNPNSFRGFFRVWFKKEWYPRISEDMQKRLDEKYEAKSRNSVLGTLRTAASSVMLRSTRTLQAEMACSAVTSRSTVEFKDYYVLYWGSLNVSGNQSKPTIVSFVGFNRHWYAMPRWESGRLVNSLPTLDLRSLARDVAAKSNMSRISLPSLPSFQSALSDESEASTTSSTSRSSIESRRSSKSTRRMKSTRLMSLFG